MLKLNLFHEQIQIQREKDFDPVKLTILSGIGVLLIICLWALSIFIKAGPVREKLAKNQIEHQQKKKDFEGLGALTDFPKIQAQAMSLQNRVDNRLLFATQLDILNGVIPTNCQLKAFKTIRDLKTIQENKMDAKKRAYVVKKTMPVCDLTFTVSTRAKTKVEVLQIRDNLIDHLQGEAQFKPLVHQVRDEGGGTNQVNEVSFTSITQDPKAGEMAVGIFDFKMPLTLKDPPKE